jgi:hypothetical protein
MTSNGDSSNPCFILLHRLFPAFKVDRPRKRHKHHKLSECQVAPLGVLLHPEISPSVDRVATASFTAYAP